MKRGHVLARVIEENKIEKMAEIGVFKCRTARAVLRYRQVQEVLKEYWAIDVWSGYYGGSQSEWETYHYGACRYMAHFPQLRVVRLSSLDAASIFEKFLGSPCLPHWYPRVSSFQHLHFAIEISKLVSYITYYES